MDQLTNQPTKRCSKCGEDRDHSWFSRDWKRRDFRTQWCKPCMRAAARIRRTGLTPEEYDRLLVEQNGSCGICRVEFDEGHPARIDRGHGGTVRGLLCARCKIGLSTFEYDVDRLRRAAAYLAR